jgi:hypothetical protein
MVSGTEREKMDLARKDLGGRGVESGKSSRT